MERDQYLCGVTATREAVDLIPMVSIRPLLYTILLQMKVTHL